MLGMNFAAARGSFFDRAAVVKATDRATRQNLSRFGAFVRTTAQRSLRTRKKVSDPGKPPSSHLGTLKRLTFFAFDPAKRSVVIGPTSSGGKGDAPALLEYGGETTRRRGHRAARARYRARPWLGPAFVQEQKKLDPLWRDSVR